MAGPLSSSADSQSLGSTASWVFKAVVTSLVAFAPLLLVFVAPKVVRVLGRFMGWTLKKKTEGRRSLLLSLMSEENKKFERKQSISGGESPKIGGSGVDAVSSPDGSIKVDKEWDGVVGFFHPFWYVSVHVGSCWLTADPI